MIRKLILLAILVALLNGCGEAPLPPPPRPPSNCPDEIPKPAPLVGKATPLKVYDLQIRTQVAREKERARGDCWRDDALGARQ